MEIKTKKPKFRILKINIIEKTHNYAQKHAINYGIFYKYFFSIYVV